MQPGPRDDLHQAELKDPREEGLQAAVQEHLGDEKETGRQGLASQRQSSGQMQWKPKELEVVRVREGGRLHQSDNLRPLEKGLSSYFPDAKLRIFEQAAIRKIYFIAALGLKLDKNV